MGAEVHRLAQGRDEDDERLLFVSAPMDATRVRYREQLFVTMPRGARSPPTRLPPGPSRRWQLCSGPDRGAVKSAGPLHVHADISRCGRGQIDFPAGLPGGVLRRQQVDPRHFRLVLGPHTITVGRGGPDHGQSSRQVGNAVHTASNPAGCSPISAPRSGL